MKVYFPPEPHVEMVALHAMMKALAGTDPATVTDFQSLLAPAKTAALLTLESAQADWRAECKRIADDALRHASGLRDKATVMRADADRLRAEAQQLEGEADALVKDACYE